MDELSKRLQDALSQVGDHWDADRTETALQKLPARRARRAAIRAGTATALVALIAGGAYAWWPGGPRQHVATAPTPTPTATPVPTPAPPEPTVEPLVLADGSTVIAEEDDAQFEVVRGEPDNIEVRVVRGRHRFVVDERAKRAFLVSAGDVDVKIDMFATEFSVARYDATAEVWSHSGVLKIEWEGKVQTIEAGEHAVFPPVEADADATDADSPADATPAHVRAKVEDLLRAADEARAGRRPADAEKPLRKVIDKYPRDPRAPMAAFTLGRVLLDDLDRPRDAAKAFAKARRLSPKGPLAEDALAREVEAWAAAGDRSRARDRAQQYLDKYPQGHRAPAVLPYAE